jgi:hypothetical protein
MLEKFAEKNLRGGPVTHVAGRTWWSRVFSALEMMTLSR